MANTSIILRDAKRLIERTLAMAPSGHALLDLDGRLLTCNDAYAQLLKRPVAELADGEFRTHVDQAQCYVVEAWFKAARAGESPPPREILRLRTGDGNSISVLVEVTSIQDHKGNPAGLLVVAGDVSGNAERAGVHPFEPIPDNTAYWQYDPTTDAIRLNAAAEAILGYAAGTYPCRTLKEHLEIHPSEKPTETETEAIAAFLGKRTENEDFGGLPTLYRTRRADGAQIWLQWDRHPADVSVEDGPVTITGTLRDISGPLAAFLDLWDERAKMERRARLSETAIEASGLGTWRILPGDGSAWFSDAWVRSLCYEPGELTPSLSTYFDLIHPGDRKRVKQEYTDVLSSNDARFTSDFRMRRKDGGYVWISSLGRVVESPSQPGGKALVGTQNDITAKMETRRALKVAAEKARVSAARLERLTENVPGGIFEFRIGPEGEMSFPYATSSMEKLLGLSLKALVADGANIFENVHPDDTQGLHAAITASHQTLGLFKYTYRILHSERGLRWIRITSTPVAMPDGSVIWYGSMFDVTEEVEREQALEAAAEIANVWSSRLERLTENVPGGIFEFMMNAQGAMSYRYVTPGMAALVGTTMAELHADGAASFNNVHPEDADLVQGAIERSRDDLEVVKVTYRINHPKLGLRWLRVNASPEPLPDSTVVWYGSMFDVTDEVEREQALKTTAEIAHTASARLERLTDNVPGGIFEFSIDSTGRISFPYASSGMGPLLGTTADVISNKPEAAFANIHPEDALRVQEEIGKSSETLDVFKLNYRVNHPERGQRWLQAKSTPIAQPDGMVVWYGSLFDVTDDVELAQELETARHRMETLSLIDALTGLPNRRAYDEEMAARQADEGSFGMCQSTVRIDLDHFKAVNDTLGHAAGDAVLQRVSECLRETIQEGDFAARMGGDEFVVALAPGRTAADADDLVRHLRAAIKIPFMFEGRHCRFDASFGVASTETVPAEPADLLSLADAALLEAKNMGRGRSTVFTPDMHDELLRSRQLATEIEQALENAEFVPYFHPQIDAATGAIAGFEVLARWERSGHGLIPPDDFIPVAQQMRLVQDIDRMMFDKSLATLGRLQSEGFKVPKLSFNVSGGRVHDPDIVRSVRHLQTNGTHVAFELLESILLEEEGAVFEHHIDQLKEFGIGIEVDDFGSGRASIIGVLRVSPDVLKIDSRLIAPLFDSKGARGLVNAIIDIGRSLEIDITAEGVESLDHAWTLREMGCRTLQGFAFAHPMSETDLKDYLRAFQPVFKERRSRRTNDN